MNFIKKQLGLALILLGVVLLIVLHTVHLTFVNSLLIIPLFLILAGTLCHVWAMKRESKY